MPITTINTTTYLKPNSGTSVQKTLKDEVTTYFARASVGTNGTGSLVTADGASKGVLALVGPQDVGGQPFYLFVFPAQQEWLGAASAVVENANDPNAGELYVCDVKVIASTDLTAIQPNGLNIVGIGDKPVGIARVVPYHLSGSTANDIAPAVPPSGSQIRLTIHGTTSPVF